MWQIKRTGLSEFLPRGEKEWTDGPSLMAPHLDGTYANGLVNGCGVKISNKGVSDLETYMYYFALQGISWEIWNFVSCPNKLYI